MPGVNVLVKGTKVGTPTDMDRGYTLTIPTQGGILVFSFIGFATQEADIGNRTTVEAEPLIFSAAFLFELCNITS